MIALSGLTLLGLALSAAPSNGSGYAPVVVQPAETPAPPAPPAHNVFTLLRTITRPDGTVRITINLAAPGLVSVRQPVLESVAAPQAVHSQVVHTRGAILMHPTHAIAKYPGALTLTLRPSLLARKQFHIRHRVTIPVEITFTPSGARPASQITSIALQHVVGLGREPQAPQTPTLDPGERFSFEDETADPSNGWGDLTTARTNTEQLSGSNSQRITIHAAPYPAVGDLVPRSTQAAPLPGETIYMFVYRPASTPPVGAQVVVQMGERWLTCLSPEIKLPANTWSELALAIPSNPEGCVNSGTSTETAVQAVGLQIDDPYSAASGHSIFLDEVSW